MFKIFSIKRFFVALAVMVFFLPLNTFAENFTGAYAGIGLGANALNTGYRQTKYDNSVAITVNDGEMLFNGAIFGGYGKLFERFYLGGEMVFSLSEGNAQISVRSTNNGIATVDNAKIQSLYSFSPLVRAGFLMTPSTLAYIKLGAVSTQFKSSAPKALTAAPVFTYKKYLWGFSTGAGLEVMATKEISIRADWTWNIYSKKTYTVGNDAQPDSAKLSPRENIFRVGVAYNF